MNKLIASLLPCPCSARIWHEGATPQQQKMKACNKEAADKQLKGDERKTFMSSCLSA